MHLFIKMESICRDGTDVGVGVSEASLGKRCVGSRE